MPKVMKFVELDCTEEELMNMTREEAALGLNEKQRRFCEIYTRNFNIRLAAKQAGYSPKAAHNIGYRLRQDPNCHRYIAWLKLRVANDCHIKATDIIDLYTRIAFADITDFVEFKFDPISKKMKAYLKDSDMIDGQLVSSIKTTKHGVEIQLVDKLKALEKLIEYFQIMPKDWKQEIEEKKLKLLEQKIELEKQKLGLYDLDDKDDGFIQALTETAKEVWDTELEGVETGEENKETIKNGEENVQS